MPTFEAPVDVNGDLTVVGDVTATNLGDAAFMDVGIVAGTVAAGDDPRFGAGGGPPTGAAGGVLSGTYPAPGFAQDMATQIELDAAVTAINAAAVKLHAATHASGGTDPVTLAQSQITGLTAALTAKADDTLVVHKAGAESITGAKTFTAPIQVPHMGIGNPPSSDRLMIVTGPIPGTQAATYGQTFTPTVPATSTTGHTALYLRVDTAAAAFTVNSITGLNVNAPNMGAGSSTNFLSGIAVGAMTAGASSNVGISIAAAGSSTLWLDSGALNTTANAGIGFGQNRDTRLYRSAVGELKTDGVFVVATSVAIGTNPAIMGAIRLPAATQITWRNNANTQDTSYIYHNSSGGLQINGEASVTIYVAGGGTQKIAFQASTMTFIDAYNLAVGSTTGTKIGTATTQKLGFWNTTPVVQPANTVAIDTLLATIGLRAAGGTANFASNISAPNIGGAASLNVGTTAGTVAAGDDPRFGAGGGGGPPTGAAGGVLSGTYPDPGFAVDPYARANHTGSQSYTTVTGLGGAATLNVGTVAGTVAAGDDSRFTTMAVDTAVVHIAGTETITGTKTFAAATTIASSNPAASGALRLANSGFIGWRNAALNGDHTFGLDGQNVLAASTTVRAPLFSSLRATTTLDNAVTLQSTGSATPTAGQGSTIRWSATTIDNEQAAIRVAWESATLNSYMSLYTSNATTNSVERLRIASTGDVTISGPSVTIGTTPAATGAIRLPSAQYVTWRNSTNTGDGAQIGPSAGGFLQISSEGAMAFNAAGVQRLSVGTSIAVTDAVHITTGTTTGTKIGTATSQKLGFFNATPIIQPANTVAIDDVLANLGLRASGGTANFTGALTPATLTGISVPLASLTNFVARFPYGTGTGVVQNATPWALMYHDLVAFNRAGVPTYETRQSGTWTADATDVSILFAQKDASPITIDGTTKTGVRFTWNNALWSSSVGMWLQIIGSYAVPSATADVTWEQSTDGTNWTTLHTSTGTSLITSHSWYWLGDSSSGNYRRLTIALTAGQLALSGIKVLTNRPGNQGGGKEFEYPYAWDSSKRMAFGPNSVPANGIVTVGVASSSTAADGIYFGTDTNLYRSAGAVLKTDGSFAIGASPAQSGALRLANIGVISGRATNNVDVQMLYLSGANETTLNSDNNLRFTVNGTNRMFLTPTGLQLSEGSNVISGTSTGSKIGADPLQKLAFWNSTPVVQPANTVAIDTLLTTLGLRASGGTANFTTNVTAPNISLLATDSLVVHLAGAETVAGLKTFTPGIGIGADVSLSRLAANILLVPDQTWVGTGSASGISTSGTGPDLYVTSGTFRDQFSTSVMMVSTSSAMAVNQGGSIAIGGAYNATGNNTPFGRISAYKENATDGDASGYLSLWTRPNGNMTERMRIGSLGDTTHYYSTTTTSPFSAAAMLSLKQLSATANNGSDIAFLDSAGSISSGITGRHSDHTLHYGQILFSTRGATGGFTTRLTIADTTLTLADGIDLVFGGTNGTKIGAASSRLSFYGVTTIARPAVSGFYSSDADNTIGTIKAVVQNLLTTLTNLGLITVTTPLAP
jgi:hypothetical protein